MKIVIAGAGALGSFYGGLLTRAGHDVTFLARGGTFEALSARGLTVTSALAGEFQTPVQVVRTAVDLDTPDLIFFSVKSFDLDPMADAIAPIVGPETILLAVQNGVSHPGRLRAHFPEALIAPGIVYVSANVPSPGVVVQPGGPGRVRLGGETGELRALLEPVRDALLDLSVPSDVMDDYLPPLWEKYMFICAMSGVPALTRLTLREIFDSPETTRLYHDVMVEVTEVARAQGIDLPESAADRAIEQMLAQSPMPLKGSMAYDLEAGKRLELSTLNGNVARLGEQLHVPTPMNRTIALALAPFENGWPR